MTDISTPLPLTTSFATALRAMACDYVVSDNDNISIQQWGAATLDHQNFPGWPDDLAADAAVIETFVGKSASVEALSENEPFVAAWLPLAQWMNETVRRQLGAFDVELDGDAYVTASLTATTQLEGLAHMDDDIFVPNNSVGMVAIIGELVGPRVTTGALDHPALPSMGQVTFSEAQLAACAADELDHCRCEGDQLVVFPQFGQLHAGPAAHHVAHLSPARQLLVMRARVRSSVI